MCLLVQVWSAGVDLDRWKGLLWLEKGLGIRNTFCQVRQILAQV